MELKFNIDLKIWSRITFYMLIVLSIRLKLLYLTRHFLLNDCFNMLINALQFIKDEILWKEKWIQHLIILQKTGNELKGSKGRKLFFTKTISSSLPLNTQIMCWWTERKFLNDQSQIGWINLISLVSQLVQVKMISLRIGVNWTMTPSIKRVTQNLHHSVDFESNESLKKSENDPWLKPFQVLWRKRKTLSRLPINGVEREWSTD